MFAEKNILFPGFCSSKLKVYIFVKKNGFNCSTVEIVSVDFVFRVLPYVKALLSRARNNTLLLSLLFIHLLLQLL